MPTTNMSVAERVVALKKIFSDFGIQVIDNSSLDQAITAEFGRGKRSQVTQLLTDLNNETDAAVLSVCIGSALAKNAADPQLKAIAEIMCERLPSLLQIIDVRQQTVKRQLLLEQLLFHFEQKLSNNAPAMITEENQRLLRMLCSAREQLQVNSVMQAVGDVVVNAGIIFKIEDLRRCGKILQGITPALIALNQPAVLFEQKINLSVHALEVIGRELNNTRLIKAASIIDTVHWLAKVSLPAVPDQPTVEHALQNLGISLGNISMHDLRKKALTLGLSEKEIIQVLYQQKAITVFNQQDQQLLVATNENKQDAAICGFVAKLGQDLKCKELERVAIAGICLVSMRQTYFELKTNNLTPINFSESLGLIMSNVGYLTKNTLVMKIGNSILEGVKTYVGIMATPGGPAVAVPMAICSVLSKLVLNERQKKNAPQLPATEVVLQHLLQQVVKLQQDIRRQFAAVYELLQLQHKQILITLDQSFTALLCYTQHCNTKTLSAIHSLDMKLDSLQFNLSKEFTGLYLEYIRDPVEEIDFYDRYMQGDAVKLQSHKIKLSMWLLFKAKSQKVNGRDLATHLELSNELSSYVAMILNKMNEYDSVLGLVNRYVNLELNQQLPEDLPHISTWLLAADRYVLLMNNYTEHLQDLDREPRIIADIIAVGKQIIQFVEQLEQNEDLWQRLQIGLSRYLRQAQNMATQQLDIAALTSLKGFAQACAEFDESRQRQSINAASANCDQYERFDPINLDITSMWQHYFVRHIPIEFSMAESYGMGKLLFTFTIDNDVNNFANLHVPYSHHLLPDSSRDVLYRIDAYFKLPTNPQPYQLFSSWFAYDLCNAFNRFEEYYRPKFKLKHNHYLWISLDGMSNHVAGHDESMTHKVIDYKKLAEIYQHWWTQVRPINDPAVLARVRQNPAFYAKCRGMLDQGLFIGMHTHTVEFLRGQLHSQLTQKFLSERLSIANVWQSSSQLQQILGKIDAYNAVLAVYKQILHRPYRRENLAPKFQDLIVALQNPARITEDFATHLSALLAVEPVAVEPSDFREGSFYQKVQNALVCLQLLLNIREPMIYLHA